MSSIVNVAVVVVKRPQSSVAVKVTVALPVAAQRSLRAVKSLDQVTPLHMSLASAPPLSASQAFSSAVLPLPSHSTVMSADSTSMLGGVVSSIVNVAVVVVVLPQSSDAVKVTVAAPVAPQRSLRAVKSLLQVTPLHWSLASAPPLSASQALSWAVLPLPSHSTVMSADSTSMLGFVVSSIVNVAVVETVSPQSSVAVKVTVAAPVAPQRSLRAVKSLDHVTPLHWSLASAPPLSASQALSWAVLPLPSHSTVMSADATSRLGLVVSSIVNVAVVVVVLPQSSDAVKMTVAAPVAPQRSLRAVKSLLHVTALQSSVAAPAPPLEASQLLRAAVLPAPSHSTVMSIAGLAMTGSVVSSMVNVAVLVETLPHSSVA